MAISLSDCGNSFPDQDYVFQKEGPELATAPVNAGSFVPSGRNEWRTEIINLDQFAGLTTGENCIYRASTILAIIYTLII